MQNNKKRKPDTDSLTLEAERSLHQSFVHAANAVSQLYSHALTHQHKHKRAHVDGARQVLVSSLFLFTDLAVKGLCGPRKKSCGLPIAAGAPSTPCRQLCCCFL